MKWLLNFSTRAKFFVGFGVMLALLLIAIFTAYAGITAIEKAQRGLYEQDFANAVDLLKLRVDQNEMRAAMLTMMALSQRPDQEAWYQDAKTRHGSMLGSLQRLLERNRDNAQTQRKLGEYKTIYEAFSRTRDAEIVPMIYAGNTAQAATLAHGIQEERYHQMRVIVTDLGTEAEENARAAVAVSSQDTRQAMQRFAVIGITAVLLAIVLALVLNRIIAKPLNTVSDIARRVASGDLTVDVPQSDRADEVGDLMRTFRTMIENQRRLMRETQEAVNVLGSSSSQILASTAQVAAGAAETSSAVRETTATVEEVKQAAEVSSRKAKSVSDSAQKVSQVSLAGRKSVEGVVQGMQRIQEQVGAVAESIVRLSEQSQAIGEIIMTVNNLTEQSNLLAVNAAIEAAKAGDQGKGFAVVAQEIRSLAEQSKQATAQVRTILSDIQKATSTAVMAAEQGSKAVDVGVERSAEAGESIRLLADSITEAAQAAAQIAASSQQQLVGMDQVALAMGDIDQASAQNVAGTQQVKATAQTLHELGQRLSSLVGGKANRAGPPALG
jgi:methyl-accepting chemotaxis protein